MAGLLAGALGSCSPSSDAGPDTPLLAGVVTTVKALGRIYTREVTEVKGNIIVWETRLNDQRLFTRKMYLNLFELYGREEGGTFVNEIDTSVIDGLFPLAVGNEISTSGVQFDSRKDGEASLSVHILVRDTSKVEIKGSSYDVYVIDVSVSVERGEETRTIATTYWHAPMLGLNLKTRLAVDGQIYWIHVIDIQSPAEAERQRKGLGTVLIDAPLSLGQTHPLQTGPNQLRSRQSL
jgi:hypothetical protein